MTVPEFTPQRSVIISPTLEIGFIRCFTAQVPDRYLLADFLWHTENSFGSLGFTDRLIPPEEDSTLPALYNIGIVSTIVISRELIRIDAFQTDIVDRPSSCVRMCLFLHYGPLP